MTIFERLWAWLKGLISEVWDTEGPALTAWLEQFASDEGKIILSDAAQYGPQIFAGTITITDAAAKMIADLTAKGIADAQSLEETVFNALRTQTNAAAAVPAVSPVLLPPETSAAG